MPQSRTLIAEWETIEAVILAWPHAQTDWAPWLEQARETYLNIIERINCNQAGVILLCDPNDIDDLKKRLASQAKVLIIPANYNDTWVRDYGFLTCRDSEGNCYPVEFRFNGWGEKFIADDDNMVNQRYLMSLCKNPLRSSSVVAEGGALEIDENGHLLSTEKCLLNPKRNGNFTLTDYTNTFTDMLGCKTFSVLKHGHLEGDDTDGHVDTLVRFTCNGGVVIQAADNRTQDSHYAELTALCRECASVLPEHQQYRLPLPYIVNSAGERLPASYANFLICNQAVLLPIYGQPEDDDAIAVMKHAYPNHTIEPIDCSVLIKQYGSLHCISMQVPKNTLTPSILSTLSKGVTVHATN